MTISDQVVALSAMGYRSGIIARRLHLDVAMVREIMGMDRRSAVRKPKAPPKVVSAPKPVPQREQLWADRAAIVLNHLAALAAVGAPTPTDESIGQLVGGHHEQGKGTIKYLVYTGKIAVETLAPKRRITIVETGEQTDWTAIHYKPTSQPAPPDRWTSDEGFAEDMGSLRYTDDPRAVRASREPVYVPPRRETGSVGVAEYG